MFCIVKYNDMLKVIKTFKDEKLERNKLEVKKDIYVNEKWNNENKNETYQEIDIKE